MKKIKLFEEFQLNEITVNTASKQNKINSLIKDAKEQIIDAGKAGQNSVIVNFSAPNYGDGRDVMETLNDIVKIQERGFATEKYNDGYHFSISCEIVDKKIVDKKAAEKAIEDGKKSALEQAQTAADNGSDYVTIRLQLPNLGDADPIMAELEKENVKCVERGFQSGKTETGSWKFAIRCKIG